MTPDKRKVFLHAEKALMEGFQAALQQLWEPSRSTYAVHDALGLSQQAGPSQGGGRGKAGRAGKAAAAFSRFASGGAAAVGEGEEAEPQQQEEEDGQDAEPGPGSEGAQHAAAASGDRSPLPSDQSPRPREGGVEEPQEPPSKRRVALPLAAFALGGAAAPPAASPPGKAGAGGKAAGGKAGRQQAAAQQGGGKQKSLFSFGFQQLEAPDTPGEGACALLWMPGLPLLLPRLVRTCQGVHTSAAGASCMGGCQLLWHANLIFG